MRDTIIRISLYGNITTKEPLVDCSRYNHFRILLTGPLPLLIVELKCLYNPIYSPTRGTLAIAHRILANEPFHYNCVTKCCIVCMYLRTCFMNTYLMYVHICEYNMYIPYRRKLSRALNLANQSPERIVKF